MRRVSGGPVVVHIRAAWQANTAYYLGDVYTYLGGAYEVTAPYTSGGSFGASDLANTAVLESQSGTYASRDDAARLNAPLWEGIYNGVTYRNAVVCFRFDDNPTKDFTTVFPLLTARYLVGGFAINPGRLGTTGYFTAANALTMQQAGMEIMNHTHSHGIDPASFNEFLTEAITSKAEVEALTGLFCQSFVQPGTWVAGYNMNTVASVETSWGRRLRQYYAGFFAYVPEAQIDGRGKLIGGRKYGALHYSPSTLADAQAAVDIAINQGLLLEILVHSNQLDTGGWMTTAEFTTLLDYVQTKRDAGLVDVLTPTGGLYAKQSNPRVNVCVNPSFDVGNFTGWGISGSPTLVVGGGRTPGRNAAQVNNANYVSRTMKCAEMRSVLVEAWVKNATPGAASTALLQVYSRDPNGSTQYGLRDGGGGIIATTDTWQKLQVTMGVDSRTLDGGNFIIKLGSNNAPGDNDVLYSEVAVYKLG